MTHHLEWKPEYAVGVAAVDHEHRELIDAINDVFKAAGQSADDASIEAALGEIHAAIAAHFALEENLMRKAGYDEYQAHKDDHEALLDQLVDIMDGYADDPGDVGNELGKRLGDWFSKHFATYDARLHGKLGM